MEIIFRASGDFGTLEIPAELVEKLNLVDGATYDVEVLENGDFVLTRTSKRDFVSKALGEINDKYSDVLSNLA